MIGKPVARRVTREPTLEQRERLLQQRAAITAELPDLAQRDRLAKEAADEPTLSGELRRAIHASRTPLAEIARQVQIPPLALDEFLTGERTLRSDVLDRLASSLHLQLTPRS